VVKSNVVFGSSIKFDGISIIDVGGDSTLLVDSIAVGVLATVIT